MELITIVIKGAQIIRIILEKSESNQDCIEVGGIYQNISEKRRKQSEFHYKVSETIRISLKMGGII